MGIVEGCGCVSTSPSASKSSSAGSEPSPSRLSRARQARAVTFPLHATGKIRGARYTPDASAKPSARRPRGTDPSSV